jgi:hypothetical protein
MDINHDREGTGERQQARRDALSLAVTGPLVTALLLAVWVAAGGGYFWPIWPMLGLSIVLLVAIWRAYGPTLRSLTDGEPEGGT